MCWPTKTSPDTKAHTKTLSGEEPETNHCTVPWELGTSHRLGSDRRSSVRNCEKPLSVTAIRSRLGSAPILNQRKLLLYGWLNNTWLFILKAGCIYFYEVLLRQKDWLFREKRGNSLLILINQVWEEKKYLKSLNWSLQNYLREQRPLWSNCWTSSLGNMWPL